jgi:hypothetical protein
MPVFQKRGIPTPASEFMTCSGAVFEESSVKRTGKTCTALKKNGRAVVGGCGAGFADENRIILATFW